MNLFTHDARQFKFDVLREVAKRAFRGTLSPMIEEELANLLIPNSKKAQRCCIYKEREIIRERTRMATGMAPSSRKGSMKPGQVLQVLDAACDGCSIKRIAVTDNCRKCMAKSCKSACHFDAISFNDERAFIDYSKCKECGACVKACPFNAVVETKRPCTASCSVDAIHWDELNIAQIDEDKCINCGACVAACPFGAIEDISWMVPVIELIKLNTELVAVIAPSIQGQFEDATLGQIKEAIKLLGFKDVVEAAVGADAVAKYEYEELVEKQKEGKVLTTSCCPAFVNLAKQHFPEQYKENVSTMVSPMVAMARMIKEERPDAGVVFIGPCIAKKQEAMSFDGKPDVDCVLTFEELIAMLIAKGIYTNQIEAEDENAASTFGRNFAQGGGVSKAIAEMARLNGTEVKAHYADGCQECKKALMLVKAGKLPFDVVEGMACKGGCVNGPTVIDFSMKPKVRMNKENAGKSSDIEKSLEGYAFDKLNLHVHEHE